MPQVFIMIVELCADSDFQFQLSASKIEQKGKDKEGLLGFFPKDIKKEAARGSTIVSVK